jgi:hypothetical protein
LEPDDRIFIHLKSDSIRVEYLENKARKNKYISLQSLRDIFRQNNSIDTGIMGLSGTNYVGLRRYIRTSNSEHFFFESSSQKRRLKYLHRRRDNPDTHNNTIEVETVCPGILLYACVRNSAGCYSVTAGKVFALRFPAVSDTVPLYAFPYGNSHNDGNVCWGRSMENFQQEDRFSILERFLNSPFNSDLHFHHGGLPSGRGIEDLIQILEGVTQEFNYNHLKPSTPHGTFGSLVKWVQTGDPDMDNEDDF